MSRIITDPAELESLIKGMKEYVITTAEEEIVKQRKIIHNYEALIDAIRKSGQYVSPTGNETSAQAKARWKTLLGDEYKPF